MQTIRESTDNDGDFDCETTGGAQQTRFELFGDLALDFTLKEARFAAHVHEDVEVILDRNDLCGLHGGECCVWDGNLCQDLSSVC
jgi:hypothetical protein